jgi:hypothetical protein
MIHFKDLDGFLKTVIVSSCVIIVIYIIAFIIGFILGVSHG